MLKQALGDRTGVEQTLSEQVGNYRQLLQQEQERTFELSQKVSEQQREVMELRHKESALESKQEQLEVAETRFRNENANIRKQVNDLESELHLAVEQGRKALSDMRSSQMQVSSLERQVETLQDQLHAYEKAKMNAPEKTSRETELQHQLNEVKNVHQIQEADLQAATEREKGLRQTVQKYNSQLNDATLAQTLAEDKVGALNRRVATLQSQIETLRTEQDQNSQQESNQLAQVNNKLTVLRQQLTEAERRTSVAEADLLAVKPKLAAAQKETTSLNAQIDMLKSNQIDESSTSAAKLRDAEDRNAKLIQTIEKQTLLIEQQTANRHIIPRDADFDATTGVGLTATTGVTGVGATGVGATGVGATGVTGVSQYNPVDGVVKPAVVNGKLLSNSVVASDDLPSDALVYIPPLSGIDVVTGGTLVTGTECNGGQPVQTAVVCLMKSRLVSALFGLTSGLLEASTGLQDGEESDAKKRALRAVLGPLFDNINWHSKATTKKLDVAKVLSRVKLLWDLGEDLRLGLVQLDPSLSQIYKETKTLASDWKVTLDSLRGSAQVLEDRNKEVETLCHSYKFSAQEARAMADIERERARVATAALKKHVKRGDDISVVAEERDSLVKEVKRLRQALCLTVDENKVLQIHASSKERRKPKDNRWRSTRRLSDDNPGYMDIFSSSSPPAANQAPASQPTFSNTVLDAPIVHLTPHTPVVDSELRPPLSTFGPRHTQSPVQRVTQSPVQRYSHSPAQRTMQSSPRLGHVSGFSTSPSLRVVSVAPSPLVDPRNLPPKPTSTNMFGTDQPRPGQMNTLKTMLAG